MGLMRGRGRYIPLLFSIAALLCIIMTLAICGAMYDPQYREPPGYVPAISSLGAYGSAHTIFASGFFVASLLLGAILVFRAAQLDAELGAERRCLTLSSLVVGLLAPPGLIIMGVCSAAGPLGTLHFIAACEGMGMLCIYGVMHAIICLLGNLLEWLGVALVIVQFAPYIVFFLPNAVAAAGTKAVEGRVAHRQLMDEQPPPTKLLDTMETKEINVIEKQVRQQVALYGNSVAVNRGPQVTPSDVVAGAQRMKQDAAASGSKRRPGRPSDEFVLERLREQGIWSQAEKLDPNGKGYDEKFEKKWDKMSLQKRTIASKKDKERMKAEIDKFVAKLPVAVSAEPGGDEMSREDDEESEESVDSLDKGGGGMGCVCCGVRCCQLDLKVI
eukprot:g3290.t1